MKFTPDGGSVAVTARRDGEEAHVSVARHGPASPRRTSERIFEAFQRGDRGGADNAEGTGLGLTLSRRIVELHGGRLWMESELGVGSTFSFAIPAASRRAGRAAPEPGDRGRPARGQRPGDRGRPALGRAAAGLSRGRRLRGRDRPRDGDEGLERRAGWTPAAVILDILLPGTRRLGGARASSRGTPRRRRCRW